MTTITTAKTNTKQVNVGCEVSRFALSVGIGSASLLGVWACACMVSAIMSNGIVEVAKGLLGAIS